MKTTASTPTPWYADGLRFDCTRCGLCCTGAAGYVWVGMDEVERLARHLGLSLDELGRRHLRRVGTRYALLEKADGDCTFLRDGGCLAYAARPRQCVAFPFWERNLGSAQSWAQAARDCEGIRDDAPLVERETIERLLANSDGTLADETASRERRRSREGKVV